jgi:hypothetical protein
VLKFEPFLLEEENLLGSCGTGRGFVCATDLRLLSVEKGVLGRRIRDLSYREISSVAVVDRLRRSWIALGLIVLACGGALPGGAPQLLAYLGAPRPMRFTPLGEQSLFVLGAGLALAGLLLIGLGLFRRRTYVELDGPHMLRGWTTRASWRFPMPTASDARVFAGLLRRQIASQSGGAAGRKVLPSDTY